MLADDRRALRRALGALTALLTLLPAVPAWSVPAFARQMNVPCAVCHTLAFGPALTAYGRNFKLHAYALGGKSTIPVSAAVITSFTHTATAQPQPPHYSDNNNFAIDEIDVYVAGRITEHSGGFAQVSHDGIFRHTQWAAFDVRYARDVELGKTSALFGVTLNNYPTVQDPWNSTFAWQFPSPSPRLTNGPAAGPQLNGLFATQVLGGTAYALIDNTVYLEAGGYRKLGDRLQEDVGITHPAAEHAINGTAPYWRAALQRWQGPHYVSLGLIGFYPRAQVPQERSFGTDNYSDLGFDATYQLADGGPNTVNAYASYVKERARLFGATATGGSSVVANHLNALNISGQYVWRQTWSATLAFFDLGGNTNALLLPASPWFGSANGSPDSRGYTMQIECVPFGKADSFARPWLNLRVGLQYTAYTRFNGGTGNYDGFGHSAHDNDALFLFLWMAL